MWFGDGNKVWHRETHNLEITRVLVNKIEVQEEDFAHFFTVYSLASFVQMSAWRVFWSFCC